MSEENKDIEPKEKDVKKKIRELVFVGGAMITVLYIFHEAKHHVQWANR